MDEHQAQQHPGDAVQQRGLVALLVHRGEGCCGHCVTGGQGPGVARTLGSEKPRGPAGPPGQGAAAPGGSKHRDGAEAPGLELAGPLMGQLSRHEAGLLHGATTAAIEDGDALGSACLAATGIDVHQELADFAAGERGSHHEGGEGHPRQASAVATRQGRLAEAPGPILAGARRLGQRCFPSSPRRP